MTGLTLFSGGGGVELGLRHLVHFVGGVEYDAAIAAHAQAALGTPITCADVCEVDYTQWAGVGYLHASPPCTNASVANAKAGETEQDKRMAQAVCRAIAQTNCRYFSLENVAGYAGFDSFAMILSTLKAQGFRVHWSVYDAADFGVPQRRRRIMLRAWRDSKSLPEVLPTHGNPKEVEESRLQPKLFAPALLPWAGWYDAIVDLLPSCPDSRLAPWQVKRLEAQYGEDWVSAILKTAVLVGGGNRSQSFLDFAVDHRKSIPEVKEGQDPIFALASTSSGDIRAVLVDQLNAGSGGTKVPGMRQGNEPSFGLTVYSPKHPAPRAVLVRTNGEAGLLEVPPHDVAPGLTTDSGSKLRAILTEPYRVVALTPRCLARFQSIPDDYELPISKSLATKIIGNAVPCGLARAVFGVGMLEMVQ